MASDHKPFLFRKAEVYTGYQLLVTVKADGKNNEDVMLAVIVKIFNWLWEKFEKVGVPIEIQELIEATEGELTTESLYSFEVKSTKSYSLDIRYDNEKTAWALKLTEPDAGNDSARSIIGRTFETNFAVGIKDGEVYFGIKSIISVFNKNDIVTGFRPAIVDRLICDDKLRIYSSGIEISKVPNRIKDEVGKKRIQKKIDNNDKTLPVLVFYCKENSEDSIIAEKMAEKLYGYAQIITIDSKLKEKEEPDLMIIMGKSTFENPFVTLNIKPLSFFEKIIIERIKENPIKRIFNFDGVRFVDNIIGDQLTALEEEVEELTNDLSALKEKLQEAEKALNKAKKNFDKTKTKEEPQEIRELEETVRKGREEQDKKRKNIESIKQKAKDQRERMTPSDDKKPRKILFVGGGQKFKEKDLANIVKTVLNEVMINPIGSPKDYYEWIKYDECTNYDWGKLMMSFNKYSDIIVGSAPHSARGIGEYNSLIEYLIKDINGKDGFGLPKVQRIADPGTFESDNFSKTNIEAYLKNTEIYRMLRAEYKEEASGNVL